MISFLSRTGVTFLNVNGQPIEKKASPLDIREQEYTECNHTHFMLKEIEADLGRGYLPQ